MKIRVIENYLNDVIRGELVPQQEIIRQINLIIQKLPKSSITTLNVTSTGIYFHKNLRKKIKT